MRYQLDATMQRRHKWRNLIHSALLLVGMAGVLGLAAGAIFGVQGAIWAIGGSMLGFAFGPRILPEWVMRAYRASQLSARDFPEGIDLVHRLAERAGLEQVPRLFYIPSSMLNAFAVGKRDDAAIGITDGMIRALTLRELAGVLAHEVSHVRNNDLWIMGLADAMSRVLSLLAFVGMPLLFVGLFDFLGGGGGSTLLAAILLLVSPTIGSLLQMALSRAREHDADLDAAGLTGDPAGLASALAKLERRQGRYWEEILLPGRRMPDPSLLRTHPPTEERIERLMSLVDRESEPFAQALPIMTMMPRVDGPPCWRRSGYWY